MGSHFKCKVKLDTNIYPIYHIIINANIERNDMNKWLESWLDCLFLLSESIKFIRKYDKR